MSTAAPTTANQQDAARSTGPGTPQNPAATSTGTYLLPGEDPAEFEELLLEYDNEFQPDSEHEHFLVALLAESRWKLARYERLQSLALDQILAAGGPEQSPDARILAALSQPNCVLDRLQRYAAQAERTYLRAHRELVQIQRQRVKDHGTALDAQLARVLDAPMPDHPQYGAYRDILQNEANPTPNPPTPPEYVLK